MSEEYQDDVNKPLQEPKDINVLKLPTEESKKSVLLCSLFPPKLFFIADKIMLLFPKYLRSVFSICSSSLRSP